jgi:hypothetical protein
MADRCNSREYEPVTVCERARGSGHLDAGIQSAVFVSLGDMATG